MKSPKTVDDVFSLEATVISNLIDKKSYPDDSIIYELNVEGSYHTIDVAIVGTKKGDLIAAIELKRIESSAKLAEVTKVWKTQEERVFS